jgi:phosphatidate cytidylyltransferase
MGAIAMIAPVLGLLWLDGAAAGGRPGIWLVPLGLALVSITSAELYFLSATTPARDRSLFRSILLAELVLAVSVAPIVLPALRSSSMALWGWTAVAIMTGVMLRILVAVADFRKGQSVSTGIALDVFQTIYVTLPLVFLLHLRMIWPDGRGLWALASIPWIVKISDTGAYFAGRHLGRTAMAPKLSPKKTWEGAAGGLIAAVIAAVLFFVVARLANSKPIAQYVTWWEMMLFGLVLAIAGICGDLAESLMKRDAGQKDSSTWLPGLGGALDVLDSILWAAPVGYVCWLLWLERGI